MQQHQQLADTIERLNITTWRTLRSRPTMYSQGKLAARDMTAIAGTGNIEAMTKGHVLRAISQWQAHGLAPQTINRRLLALKATGLPVETLDGLTQAIPKALKWWLSPEAQKTLQEHLPADHLMLDYIEFITEVGLRVEEALRIERKHFTGWDKDHLEITVQGLKTTNSMATLPLPLKASAVVRKRLASSPPDARLFPVTYTQLADLWDECRKHLGEEGNPTATLKALRRSAARNLHATKGMPLDLVRHYLRHEDVKTTMSYLRLTGGYKTEELLQWL